MSENLLAIIVISVFGLIMAAAIITCIVLLAKGVKQQKRYNNTALPSLVKEAQELNGEEESEEDESSAFDLETAEEEYYDEGFETNKWFAQARDLDEESIKETRKKRKETPAASLPEPEKALPQPQRRDKEATLPKF